MGSVSTLGDAAPFVSRGQAVGEEREDVSVFSLEASLEERLSAIELIDPLSPRETEVASLVFRGNTVPAIARKLFISENTVRGHMKAIYRKLGVHSKQELIDLLG